MPDFKSFYVNNTKIETDKHTVLDAILDAGYCLSHSCKDGRCETCIVREVESGEEFLACQNSFKEGLYYEADSFSKTRLPPELNIAVKVSNISIHGNFTRISLQYSKSISIESLPGQYIDLTINNVVRSYSILAIDNDKKSIDLLISLKEGGVASTFFSNHENIGEILRAVLPKGSFFVDEIERSKHIFICTGSGIVPVYHMLTSIKALREKSKVYWGLRYKCDFSAAITEQFKDCIEVFYSGEIHSPGILTGRLPLETIIRSQQEKSFWYGSGNVQMLADLKHALSESEIEHLGLKMDPFY